MENKVSKAENAYSYGRVITNLLWQTVYSGSLKKYMLINKEGKQHAYDVRVEYIAEKQHTDDACGKQWDMVERVFVYAG